MPVFLGGGVVLGTLFFSGVVLYALGWASNAIAIAISGIVALNLGLFVRRYVARTIYLPYDPQSIQQAVLDLAKRILADQPKAEVEGRDLRVEIRRKEASAS